MFKNDIKTIIGKKAGKTVTILAGVHGNEPCGLKVLKKISKELKIKKGKVNLIVGNPRAVRSNCRFIEMNLNRAFRPTSELSIRELSSYERKRAEQIMPYLENSDYVLDIHSSSSKITKPFVICEPQSYEVVSFLPVSIISSNWDKFEPGGTDYFTNLKGGKGICIESGYSLDSSGVGVIEKSVKNLLIFAGLIEGQLSRKTKQQKIKISYVYVVKNLYYPVREFSDFEFVESGQVVGYDGKNKIKAPFDGFIIFNNSKKKTGEEGFILGKPI